MQKMKRGPVKQSAGTCIEFICGIHNRQYLLTSLSFIDSDQFKFSLKLYIHI